MILNTITYSLFQSLFWLVLLPVLVWLRVLLISYRPSSKIPRKIVSENGGWKQGNCGPVHVSKRLLPSTFCQFSTITWIKDKCVTACVVHFIRTKLKKPLVSCLKKNLSRRMADECKETVVLFFMFQKDCCLLLFTSFQQSNE